MRTRGSALIGRVIPALVVAIAVPLAAGSPAGAVTGADTWSMQSQPGDYIGAGQSYAFSTADGAQISASGNASLIEAKVTEGADSFTASFQAPAGSVLTAGTSYDDATDDPSATQAGLNVYGDSRGCGHLTGSFDVDAATFGVTGAVTSLRIEFTQLCGGSTGSLTGTIDWTIPPDSTPPGRVTDLFAGWTAVDDLTVGWANPADPDYYDTVVRYAKGHTPPATPSSGQLLYDGNGGSATISLPEIPAGYSFSAFARDATGNVSTRSSYYLAASAQITLHRRPGLVEAGHFVTFTGRMTVFATGQPMGHHPMRMMAKHPWQLRGHEVAKFRTHADGRFRVRLRVWHETKFWIWDSFTNRADSGVGPVTVAVTHHHRHH